MRILHYAVPIRTRRVSVCDEHVWVRDEFDAEEFFEQDAALVVWVGERGGGGGEAFERDGVLELELELALRVERCFSSPGTCLQDPI